MKISIIGGILAISTALGSGATLVEYNFNGGADGVPDYSPTTTGSGVNVSAVSPTGTFVRSGSDLTGVTGGGTLAVTFGNIGKESPPVSGAAARTYISFTIGAASPGQIISLTSLSFLTNLATAQASGANYTLQYGSASDPSGFMNLSLSPNTAQVNSTIVTRTADLSGIDFSSFTSGVTFRINVTQPIDSTATGSSSARIDMINVQGSVIPEPGSAALFVVGTAGVLLGRRRK
ncbi:PEP-CTERM sorting domain-containing protein [Luteolibacter sp. SL250]|uniref:PEP-CTERM sorting domain-containing protein n=1 Tax=Luteolibacter sp. SL250 TaxID=2995170 RepID=UPI0022718D75|nr:PEP-CTERM sorting domain-containing protein [Luteolibacter sp. SL250]WAC20880.1 PEP-CTERM sorting domain-containing protein [Luteolibacter sp. SL250]